MGSDSTALGGWTPAVFGRAATLSVATYAAQAALGFATLVLAGLNLTAEARGYFFTFASLIALFPLAEFGASYALMQSVSHEGSRLSWGPSGLSGSAEAVHLTSGIFGIALIWNTLTTALATCALAAAGHQLFRAQLQMPWLVLLAFAAARQWLSPWIAFLEGSGRVADVWRFRLHQELIGGGVLVGCLLGRAGLYSLGASWVVRWIHGALWLGPRDRRSHPSGWGHIRSVLPYWQAHVWPFQWRIGTSAVAGFFTYYLFNPLLLAIRGPVEAGRFGMTMAIVNGWQNATTAWLTSQAPRYGDLIATRRMAELRSVFRRTFLRSTSLSATGCAFMVAAMIIATGHSPGLASRLLPPLGFAALVATAVVNHAVFGLAVYLRAHRRDPLLVPSVIGAVCTPLMTMWAARQGAASLVALLYLGLTLIGLLMAVYIFVQARERWLHLERQVVQ